MRILTTALLLALSLPAMAAQEIVCNPDGNQLELNQCAADELSAADADLNAVYRQIMTSLAARPGAQTSLRASQRLWIQLRDANLDALFPLEDGEEPRVMYGSMYPMSHASAKAELTRARSSWLRSNFIENDG
jgi:uncharacterized protein YecT (DUF1311 family)